MGVASVNSVEHDTVARKINMMVSAIEEELCNVLKRRNFHFKSTNPLYNEALLLAYIPIDLQEELSDMHNDCEEKVDLK